MSGRIYTLQIVFLLSGKSKSHVISLLHCTEEVEMTAVPHLVHWSFTISALPWPRCWALTPLVKPSHAGVCGKHQGIGSNTRVRTESSKNVEWWKNELDGQRSHLRNMENYSIYKRFWGRKDKNVLTCEGN